MGLFAALVGVHLILLIYGSDADYPYKTDYFVQTIDHFNQMTVSERTFKQKYIYQDAHWKAGVGPILFYAGHEAPIEVFWGSSGFIHEMAPEVGALVVYAEHRFYGTSLPFGKSSFRSPNLGYLTIEQAIADYAVFLTDLKKTRNATNCKVIAFGGSYGGILAAYMRFKYPNIIDGSLAASAPIYMQSPACPRDFFFPLVTKDFRDYSQSCYDLVKKVFVSMDTYASKGTTGLKTLSGLFHLCQPLKDMAGYQHLLRWVRNAFSVMAMLDYPYKTSFIGSLPAHPVKVACDTLLGASNPLTGMSQAAGVFYNNSLKCFDIFAEFQECASPIGCGTTGNDAIGWDYQTCTEIWLPGGTNNVTDMFPVMPWTAKMREEHCKKTYGVTPRQDWPSIQFWGEKIKTASNIIFSNGNLDPYRGGGVLKDISDTVVAVLVKGGAHHLDLRSSNPADPPGVVKAREQERKIIRKWISEP